MSPQGRWGNYYEAQPRRAVQGGVVVAKPGKVTDPVAVEVVEAATMETGDKILARGRTYARAGQVVEVHTEPRAFTAQIQGSGKKPYEVRLDRIVISGSDRLAADCTCPYGCDHDWCKHAAALAYVAAFMLDRDPQVRAVWAGEEPAAPAGSDQPVPPVVLSDDELEALRSPLPQVDVRGLLAAADAVVPHPWGFESPAESP
ncbi:MAG: SWIM zinc finger family protein [Candidatus Nanopelagicales bacterium]